MGQLRGVRRPPGQSSTELGVLTACHSLSPDSTPYAVRPPRKAVLLPHGEPQLSLICSFPDFKHLARLEMGAVFSLLHLNL